MLNACSVRSVCAVSQGKASEFSKVIGNKKYVNKNRNVIKN